MSSNQRQWLHQGSIGYLLAYLIPSLLIVSAWLGQVSGYANAWAFFPLVIAYFLTPAINWKRPVQALPAAVNASSKWQTYYALITLLSLPVQLAMLYVATEYWNAGLLDSWGSLAWLWSTGIFSTFLAINASHELIHSKNHSARLLGGVLLSTVGFGTFKIVHLRIHHRYVGTPRDFSTARRGQSLYAFWCQSLSGNFRQALRYERKRLGKVGKNLWHSELVVWYGLTLLWLGLSLILWGWWGGLFFVLQSLVAIMKLEWVNYLQHYGLTRKKTAHGKYESVQPHHVWSQEHVIVNLAFLNLMRHADHHANPQKPYQNLLPHKDAPAYPYDFSFMFLLALVTPLFQRIVHPHLDRFVAQQQTVGT